MKILEIEASRKIIQNREKLEEALKVKILVAGKKIKISGKEIDEYNAEKVMDAINSGFRISSALLLLNDEYVLEKVNIKELSRKNLKTVRARIIGTYGRTLKILCQLSDCDFVLRNNTVSIIGNAESLKIAINALKSLICGSKQSNVYSYLERARKRHFEEDLGLKERKNNN